MKTWSLDDVLWELDNNEGLIEARNKHINRLIKSEQKKKLANNVTLQKIIGP